MNIQNTLIQNLITVRKHRGLTQTELGKQIGYSDKTISKWENGDSCPSIEALYQLSQFYGVSIDDLLSESFQIVEKGEEETEPESDVQDTRSYHKVILAILLPLMMYVVAVPIFVVLLMCSVPHAWLAFIDAIPFVLLSLLFLGYRWHFKVMTYISGSGIMWTVALAVFLHLLVCGVNAWPLFLAPIPLQIAIILLAVLKKKK